MCTCRILSCLLSALSCLSVRACQLLFILIYHPNQRGFRVSLLGLPPARDGQINRACKCFSSLVPGVRNSSASGSERKHNHWGRAAVVFCGAGIVQGRFPVYPAPLLSRIVHLQSTSARAGGARLALLETVPV